MDTISLKVGTYSVGNGGIVQDATRPVEFEGEQVAQTHVYGTDRVGSPSDTRGTTETLYRAADGRLVVYVEDWSKWQGEGVSGFDRTAKQAPYSAETTLPVRHPTTLPHRYRYGTGYGGGGSRNYGVSRCHRS